MAHMYPPNGVREGTKSPAEREIYDILKHKLSNEYTVIHSLRWNFQEATGHAFEGEADFVIIHPQRGIITLEVKGGLIGKDPKGWFTIGLRGEHAGKRELLRKDPFLQAEASQNALLACLRRAQKTKRLSHQYRVIRAIWFPDTVWEHNEYPAYPDWMVLDSADKIDPEPALQRVYTQLASELSEPVPTISKAGLKNMLDLLEPSITPHLQLANIIADQQRDLIRLTEEQIQQLKQIGFHARLAISGGAGTGKTVLAYEAACRLAEEGLRVLFLCLSTAQMQWLQGKYADKPFEGLQIASDAAAFPIWDIRTLARQLAKAANLSADEIAGLRIKIPADQRKLAQLCQRGIDRLEKSAAPAGQQAKPWQYDAIIVDEAQDVEEAMWAPIQRLLSDRDEGRLYIFYDKAQRVDLPGEWKLTISGDKTMYVLNKNVRNSGTIYAKMQALNPQIHDIPFGDGPAGIPLAYLNPRTLPPPGQPYAAAERQALKQVLDDLLQPRPNGQGQQSSAPIKPEDILVIICNTYENSRLDKNRVLEGYRFCRLIDGKSPAQIRFSTIRAVKGLEAKIVILAELDGLQREKNPAGMLYIAVSRAKHHLIVLGTPAEISPAVRR